MDGGADIFVDNVGKPHYNIGGMQIAFWGKLPCGGFSKNAMLDVANKYAGRNSMKRTFSNRAAKIYSFFMRKDRKACKQMFFQISPAPDGLCRCMEG